MVALYVWVLRQKNAHNVKYQFWQQNNHAFDLFSNKFIDQKVNYIHNNPVETRIVTEPHFYVYSSANQFTDLKLVELWSPIAIGRPEATRIKGTSGKDARAYLVIAGNYSKLNLEYFESWNILNFVIFLYSHLT